jgi:hypothetical protein
MGKIIKLAQSNLAGLDEISQDGAETHASDQMCSEVSSVKARAQMLWAKTSVRPYACHACLRADVTAWIGPIGHVNRYPN